MTDLQTGLIALGAALLVGIYAYNQWQERRQRHTARNLLTTRPDDVLFGLAPSRSDEPAPQPVEEASQNHQAHPPSQPAAQTLSPSLAASHASSRYASVDTGNEQRVEHAWSPVAPPVKPDDAATGSPAEQNEDCSPGQNEAAMTHESHQMAFKAHEPGTSDALVPEDASVTERDEELAEDYTTGSSQYEDVDTLYADGRHTENEDGELELPDYLLSPLVDCIVKLESRQPVSSLCISQAQRFGFEAIPHSIRWAGFDEYNQRWEYCGDQSLIHYRHYAVGLQLVDRSGPAQEAEIAAFLEAVDQLQHELGAKVTLKPTMAESCALASQLEDYCSQVDIQIGINLNSVSNVGLLGMRIHPLAESCSMQLEPEIGAYVRRNSNGGLRFQLQNFDPQPFSADQMKSLNTGAITFLLDVPRTVEPKAAFDEMLKVANDFRPVLAARLVDDRLQPLDESQLVLIREYIDKTVCQMQDYGIPPGCELALRLFS